MTQKLILPPSRATNIPLDVWSFFSPRQMLPTTTPRASGRYSDLSEPTGTGKRTCLPRSFVKGNHYFPDVIMP